MMIAAESLTLTEAPVAKAELLIRKPAAEVFEAFVDPAVTTQFWFTSSSGRLEPGSLVEWRWEMYDASTRVRVIEIEQDRRIRVEWDIDKNPTTVEWRFTALPDETTFVSISNWGFTGDGDSVVNHALDSGGGFALVLAGLKALLEHDIRLNLVTDRFPAALADQE